MNSATMLFLLPHGLQTIGIWEERSATDLLYWRYYPFQAYFVNVFGFCAMWSVVPSLSIYIDPSGLLY